MGGGVEGKVFLKAYTKEANLNEGFKTYSF